MNVAVYAVFDLTAALARSVGDKVAQIATAASDLVGSNVLDGFRRHADVFVAAGFQLDANVRFVDIGELVVIELYFAGIDVLPVDVVEVELAVPNKPVETVIAINVDVVAMYAIYASRMANTGRSRPR